MDEFGPQEIANSIPDESYVYEDGDRYIDMSQDYEDFITYTNENKEKGYYTPADRSSPEEMEPDVYHADVTWQIPLENLKPGDLETFQKFSDQPNMWLIPPPPHAYEVAGERNNEYKIDYAPTSPENIIINTDKDYITISTPGMMWELED
jgi:hypothetical protein